MQDTTHHYAIAFLHNSNTLPWDIGLRFLIRMIHEDTGVTKEAFCLL